MYQSTPTGGVVRVSDQTHIPLTPGNRDHQAYALWLSAGNTPAPAAPVPPPTKDERIAAILSVIPDLTRRDVQAIIAITELDAKLELSINGTSIETTLADSLVRNKSYKVARHLEDLCRVVDKS